MKVTGAKEVADSLNKGAKKPIKDNLPKLASKVERNVKKATVVGETGVLRSGTHTTLAPNMAIIYNQVEYAEPIEYGTDRFEARHMEGGSKVLGEGMFAYTERTMAKELKDFEVQILKDIQGEFK